MFPVESRTKPLHPPSVEPSSSTSGPKLREIKESTCYLASVTTLRESVNKSKHENLTEIINTHVFVGIVDMGRCLSLVQHAKKLYLVNHGALAEEMFYQLGLRQFGNFGRLKLEPAPSLRTLISIAVKAEEGVHLSPLSPDEIVEVSCVF